MRRYHAEERDCAECDEGEEGDDSHREEWSAVEDESQRNADGAKGDGKA
jgi:hypothetical protein